MEWALHPKLAVKSVCWKTHSALQLHGQLLSESRCNLDLGKKQTEWALRASESLIKVHPPESRCCMCALALNCPNGARSNECAVKAPVCSLHEMCANAQSGVSAWGATRIAPSAGAT